MISYLQVESLTKSYGDLVLFENLNFGVNQGEKIALIAKNGTGKTSLLNLLSDKDSPDSGSIIYRNNIEVGQLDQNSEVDPNNTVFSEIFNSSNKLLKLVGDYYIALEKSDDEMIISLSQEIDNSKAWDLEIKAKQILSKLKINNLNQKVSELSGGQIKRLCLAKVLISEPDFLILDEPTNHLDLDMIEWLEDYLTKSKATLLMVTHDRYFLDRVCNKIFEIENKNIYTYKGNYSYYIEKREERIQNMNTNAQKAKKLLKTEQEWMRRMPQARGTKAKYRIDAFYELKKEAKKGFSENFVNINIKPQRLGKLIMEIESISKSYDKLNLIENFTYKFQKNEKIGIVGVNGAGKSTFLNLITSAIEPDGGSINIGETVKIGYYRQEGIIHDENQKLIDVIKEISEYVELGNGQRISASQFLENFLFSSEAQYNYVHKLSGGEKRRLYLMTVLMKNPNFLILDEPTNDLDIATLNILEQYLINFDGCVVIVSHDRFFMDKLVDHIFAFEGDGKIKDYPGNYSMYRIKKSIETQEQVKPKPEKKETQKKPKNTKTNKLSFKEKKELEEIEPKMEEYSLKIEQLNNDLSSGNFQGVELLEKSKEMEKLTNELDEMEMRWLELSEKE
ncbi:MAG: ABC-F family ATP-binding cassette domain-containing protein [Marinifilaceae bacterium]|jgi:ATP-binding cassette subfamily F protein uup|nr:ABC-F family ATP-binding cassette domain-containing protein [Marinifilaceae bacterium]